jgi:hypothetical protein
MSAADGRVASTEKSSMKAAMRPIAAGTLAAGTGASAAIRIAQARRREIT